MTHLPRAPREDVEFESLGSTLRGWLYRSELPAPGPAVVMAHGLTAVKEMFLDSYAEAFAKAGLTTLAYDHFGFGASEGEPRQSPAISIQLQGYRGRDRLVGVSAVLGCESHRPLGFEPFCW